MQVFFPLPLLALIIGVFPPPPSAMQTSPTPIVLFRALIRLVLLPPILGLLVEVSLLFTDALPLHATCEAIQITAFRTLCVRFLIWCALSQFQVVPQYASFPQLLSYDAVKYKLTLILNWDHYFNWSLFGKLQNFKPAVSINLKAFEQIVIDIPRLPVASFLLDVSLLVVEGSKYRLSWYNK